MDYRGDPRSWPPAAYASEMARTLTDRASAESYRQLAKSLTATHAELVLWERQGLAYELSDGTIVPGVKPAQVKAALTSAQAASMTPGDGGPCDDPGFRAWLEERCRVLGLPAPEWQSADADGYAGGKPGLGPSPSTGSNPRAGAPPYGARPADARIAAYDGRNESAGKGLLTGVRVPVGSTITTPNGGRYKVTASPAAVADRAEAFAKAAEFDRQAGNLMFDPALRESYRQLAAQTRREES